MSGGNANSRGVPWLWAINNSRAFLTMRRNPYASRPNRISGLMLPLHTVFLRQLGQQAVMLDL
jgi:hypothetical protein